MTSSSIPQDGDGTENRERQSRSESPPPAVVAPTEDQQHLEIETKLATWLATSPPSFSREDHKPSPPPADNTPNSMVALNQPMHGVHLTKSRMALRPRSPKSSLPPRKFLPPRKSHPAVRPPSAMAHRAHTPLPPSSNERARTPLPNAKEALAEHEQHGETTYTSETPGQDPRDPKNADILLYSDSASMAGMFLFNANHKQAVREQVDMAMAYQQDEVAEAQAAWWNEKDNRLNRVPGK